MKKLMIALVAVLTVTLVSHFSMAKEDTQKINGVLIDAKCGKAKNTEEKAAGHPAACVTKCAANGALTLISGDKTYKLDDASKEKALGYLATEKGEGSTRVAVEGTLKEDTLTITSIKKGEKKE